MKIVNSLGGDKHKMDFPHPPPKSISYALWDLPFPLGSRICQLHRFQSDSINCSSF